MRVLIITSNTEYLNPTEEIRSYIEAHAELSEETHIVVLCGKGAGMFRAEVAPRVWLHATNTSMRVLRPFDAYRIVRDFGHLDIVVAEEPALAGLAALLVARSHHAVVQTVVRVRDFESPHGRTTMQSRLRAQLVRYVVQRSSCLRVLTEDERAYLHDLGVLRGKNVALVPYVFAPVTTTASVPQPDVPVGPRPIVKRAWPFLLLSVVTGTGKGAHAETVVRVFSELAAVYPWMGFILRVPSWYAPALKKLVRSAGIEERSAFDVMDDDEVRPLPEADALVCVADPGGNTFYVVEALRRGMPLVTSPIGIAASKLVDGESCFLCPLSDVDCFVHRVRTLVENNGARAKLSINAKGAVPPLEELSREEWLRRLQHSYESCALRIVE